MVKWQVFRRFSGVRRAAFDGRARPAARASG
jgi:hypothetical protein